MTSPLRVAIAGLGIGEKVHLPALRACAGTTPSPMTSDSR